MSTILFRYVINEPATDDNQYACRRWNQQWGTNLVQWSVSVFDSVQQIGTLVIRVFFFFHESVRHFFEAVTMANIESETVDPVQKK